MAYHDVPPESERASAKHGEMMKLVSLLQAELDADDAAGILAVVQNVVTETGYSKRAAERLKTLLTKLGKPTYGVAIKIISDIGSATVKKILGL